MAKYLTKDLILKANDIETKEVYIPEWNGTVLIKGMNGTERDAYEASLLVGKGKDKEITYDNLRAKLVAKTVVDENGERIFTDDDIAQLGKKSASAIDRIFGEAQKLCGIADEDLKEMVKNSETTQQEDSTSH